MVRVLARSGAVQVTVGPLAADDVPVPLCAVGEKAPGANRRSEPNYRRLVAAFGGSSHHLTGSDSTAGSA
jgi:hypothetical protein